MLSKSMVGEITRGIILGLALANEGRRYYVTHSFIGWPHTQNEPSTIILILRPRLCNYDWVKIVVTDDLAPVVLRSPVIAVLAKTNTYHIDINLGLSSEDFLVHSEQFYK